MENVVAGIEPENRAPSLMRFVMSQLHVGVTDAILILKPLPDRETYFQIWYTHHMFWNVSYHHAMIKRERI